MGIYTSADDLGVGLTCYSTRLNRRLCGLDPLLAVHSPLRAGTDIRSMLHHHEQNRCTAYIHLDYSSAYLAVSHCTQSTGFVLIEQVRPQHGVSYNLICAMREMRASTTVYQRTRRVAEHPRKGLRRGGAEGERTMK